MITTETYGQTSWCCGNFYHEVNIFRDNNLIDTIHVHGCEDNEEASYYAISLSNKLTQEEKENYIYE